MSDTDTDTDTDRDFRHAHDVKPQFKRSDFEQDEQSVADVVEMHRMVVPLSLSHRLASLRMEPLPCTLLHPLYRLVVASPELASEELHGGRCRSTRP